ncbi:hypothetical protein [Fluoribacter gormanii]|uniref:hypothetical protein n=1 Tax=Fluoribacter gormanii TaxID=464 RepID=UPI000731B129|nr:hypothetical protein [Fluoribacter gormanii]
MLDSLIKMYIVLGGSIIESITKIYLKGKCGKCFDKKSEYLFTKGIIDKKLKDDLNWVWSLRSNIHLYDMPHREYDSTHYARLSVVRCNLALEKLKSCLQEYSDN